jgi:preprotein translocase subunit SecE
MAKTDLAKSEQQGFMAQLTGLPKKIAEFYGDVRTEMKKVTSPSRKEVQATTTVVIITVAIFGIYFFVVDGIVSNSLKFAWKTLGGH